MSIELSEDILTGIDEVDTQHRELFRRVNSFLAACNDGRGAERVRETLEFMRVFVLEHFRVEEVMMRARGYPDTVRHRAQHQELLVAVDKLHALLQSDGASDNVVTTTRRVLVGWLVSHIRKTDKALADFLRTGAIG